MRNIDNVIKKFRGWFELDLGWRMECLCLERACCVRQHQPGQGFEAMPIYWKGRYTYILKGQHQHTVKKSIDIGEKIKHVQHNDKSIFGSFDITNV